MSLNHIKTVGISTFTAYSSVLFSSNPLIGICIFLVTFFNPYAGLTGLLGVLFSNLLAIFIGVNEERIKKGLYGFNGLLVGLSISLYFGIDFKLILMLFASIVLLVFLTLGLEYILSYFLGLPVLSIPFVLVSFIIYMAFYAFKGFEIRRAYVFPYDSLFPEIPNFILYYLKNLGGIFFQSSPWAGFSLAIILLVISRIAFFLSLLGFGIGSAFYLYLQGDPRDLFTGAVGFNYILTAIAVGGIFLVPSPSTFLLAGLAAMVSTLIASFTQVFLVQFNIPVLALPFTTVTLLFLYVAKLLHNPKFIPVDFLPGSPEENLDYFKTRLERFGFSGLYLRLPFSGKWKISQGYNGKHTHKDAWRESLDFMAVGQDNQVRKGKVESVNDYYTFGLPVLAPGAGRVVKIINHLDDNILYEIDEKNNWGNLVLIEHTAFLYSQVSHLQKGSILVKEGDYVLAGAKLGLAGNSGRSPEPHIHLHFQSTPELGSSTIPMSFTQFLKEAEGEKSILFNNIPLEGDVLSNLQVDFNRKNFFSLAPGQKFEIAVKKNTGKQQFESWIVNLDLLGNRFIEDEKLNRLYFFSSSDYFTCLDYVGNRNSGLFFFFLTYYRFPYISFDSFWADKISYKHFSNLMSRLGKDLIHPFNENLGVPWSARTKENGIYCDIGKDPEKLDYRIYSALDKDFPGSIQVKNKNGEEWNISSKNL